MGFQCVPQSIGLVRELKAGQKNRSVGKPICMESGEERASKSTTIDRTRSHENVYEGYRNGQECWDAMVADADAYRSEYTTKTGKQCSRRLPKQAIIGVQVIVNPPSAVADTWDRETHFKFQKDAAEALAEIEPRLFRSDNVMMRAHHFDEGQEDCATDTHTVYIAKDKDGHYCGSIYDANLRQRMAKEFAEKMRSRGWDIDNPELTDWERYEIDSEYRAHIDNKREKQGKSQPEYDAQQIAERAEQMEQLGAELQAAADALTEAKEQRDKAERSRKLIAGKSFKRGGESMLGVAGLEEKRDELQSQIAELETEYERIRQTPPKVREVEKVVTVEKVNNTPMEQAIPLMLAGLADWFEDRRKNNQKAKEFVKLLREIAAELAQPTLKNRSVLSYAVEYITGKQSGNTPDKASMLPDTPDMAQGHGLLDSLADSMSK